MTGRITRPLLRIFKNRASPNRIPIYKRSADPVPAPEPTNPLQGMTRSQAAIYLATKAGNALLPQAERLKYAQDFVAVAKKARISYAALGLTNAQVAVIRKLLDGQKPPKLNKSPTRDGPRQKKAKLLYDGMKNANLASLRRSFAIELLDHKRNSKISWTYLGLPQDTSKQINEVILDK